MAIISYALELGHRGQGGDAVQATLCPETPAKITVISGGRGGGGGDMQPKLHIRANYSIVHTIVISFKCTGDGQHKYYSYQL